MAALLHESPEGSPWPWCLETDGLECRLVVECPDWLISLKDVAVDLGSSEVRFAIAPGVAAAGTASGTTVVLALPTTAPKIDVDRAKCRFVRKKRIVSVSWPKLEGETNAASSAAQVATAAPFDFQAVDRVTKMEEPKPEAAAPYEVSSSSDVRKADAGTKEEASALAGDTAPIAVTEKAVPAARDSEASQQEEMSPPAGDTVPSCPSFEEQKKEQQPEEDNDPEGLDAASWKDSGNAAFKAKDLPAAIRAYSKGIRAAGGAGATTPEPAFALFSNRALCFQQLARFDAAVADAEACVKLKPDFFKGYLRGGLALKSLNKPIEAFAFMDRAPPGLVMSNAELHDLHKELQRLAHAEEERRLSEMTGPERGKTRGNALFKKAQFEEALSAYTEGIEALSTEEERVSELGLNLLNNRAACHHQLSNYSEVVRDTEAVLRVQPDNLKARLRRMLALEPMEKYREAMADARFVLSRDPANDLANKLQHRLSKVVRDMDREARGA